MERISSNDTSSTDAMLARLKEQNVAIRKSTGRNSNNSFKTGGSKKINLTNHMIRLANAKTTIQVDGIIQTVEALARSLKAKGATSQEAAAAMCIARKVRSKGTIKIYRLRKEEKLKQLSQLHESTKNFSKKNEVLKTLKSTKRARKAQEQNDVIHSIKSDYYEENHTHMQSQTNANMENNCIAVSAEITGMDVNLTESMSSSGSIDCII